ncbi:hypothetical protein [Hymenobacter arizonensis]|uniref:Uncharacterized protein n=1 Tax=Hymenobacter arizonensis TaxID=1227077 RepID=A0A1I6BMN0_HYMAR|nr:hypothetical protein [Hymenobacter arizonensis]SFQ82196.1 hypothetical protein SAMN04515668_4758 [Hymenobacter arizonensis]
MTIESDNPRLFTLIRHADETGISGTGRVLDGTIFHTGQVVVCWRSDLRTDKPGFSSLVIYNSWEAFLAIHVEPHPVEQTEIVFGTERQFGS